MMTVVMHFFVYLKTVAAMQTIIKLSVQTSSSLFKTGLPLMYVSYFSIVLFYYYDKWLMYAQIHIELSAALLKQCSHVQ